MRRYEGTAERDECEPGLIEAMGGWLGTVGVLLGTSLVAFPAASASAPVFARWVAGLASLEGILALGATFWVLVLAWVAQAVLSTHAEATRRLRLSQIEPAPERLFTGP